MPEVSQQQGNLETPSDTACTKGAEARTVPNQFESTKQAQFASPEHNQSTTAEHLPVDLQLVVGAWERLPEAVRQGIITMVKCCAGAARRR